MKITNSKKKMMTVKVSDLKTAPWNPRKQFDEHLVKEIAEDLRAGKPLIQAPSVWACDDGDGYYVIAGNTRMAAVRLAGLETVDVVVWDVTRDEAMAMTFKENEQRSDVYPVQQAQLIGKIFAEGKDVEQIVASTGLKKSSVYDYLAISRRVHPEILAVASDHPSFFTKQDLLELTSYPVEVQAPFAKEWRSECGEADEDPEDNWTPDMWRLRRDSKSLKGCKFAGPGSKCSTCPFNSANLGTLPGFEEESVGDHTCSKPDCYDSMLNAWKADQETKKLGKYAEKVRLGYAWEASQYNATEKKQTKDCPCCYWWWDGDKLRMMFGPSVAAKKAAEKEAKAKLAEEKKAKKNREALIDGVVKRIVERFGLKNGWDEDTWRSFHGMLCSYFLAIDETPSCSHPFRDTIVKAIHWDISGSGHSEPAVAYDLAVALGIETTPEEDEALAPTAEEEETARAEAEAEEEEE